MSKTRLANWFLEKEFFYSILTNTSFLTIKTSQLPRFVASPRYPELPMVRK